ncbi:MULTISPECIES: hypothetical protein [Ornithinimicrobium]|uniref:Uncharacterized protein n=2 Tax=Ornithinimicrobium TaxID=125287 RepID=A0A543KKR5_9MICO|nr:MULTISPECIES: hypothetical protein [Ornithinimicrobium]TQM95681.1 hypothetical protein FB476_0529 [Ornithinimicrobium humiphilum]GGK81374.1 hypothetical protein GCM10011509_32320 [Ornithinimicrobium pekingense]
MSDRETPARDVLALLDRAAAHTPPLHLDRRDVVSRGRQIRRRRRAGGAGTAVGVLALAGAVWLGSGVAGDALRGAEQISPAGVGREVDAQQYAEDPVAGTGSAPVGPGGSVVLLGETYEVSTDAHGWPQLLDEDGSVFLTVSDADGPPAGDGGGVVMWRDHWWPWSDRTEIYFAVDGQPTLAPDVEGQDAVTISGPAGVVGLVAVPPGS